MSSQVQFLDSGHVGLPHYIYSSAHNAEPTVSIESFAAEYTPPQGEERRLYATYEDRGEAAVPAKAGSRDKIEQKLKKQIRHHQSEQQLKSSFDITPEKKPRKKFSMFNLKKSKR